MGEEISPDFTTFDYCIGFDNIIFGDRYYKFPLAFYSDLLQPFSPKKITYECAIDILKQKKYFCNFIYRHKSTGMREKLFHEINKYKNVISPGNLLNNVNGSSKGCSWTEKYDYLRCSKFTIAAESLDYPGYMTEKVIQSFECHSVPIFWGNSQIDEYLNTKSFVWCKSEDDIERMIKQIECIDNDDEKYISMLMEYPFVNESLISDLYFGLEAFLVNIMSKEKEKAYKRPRCFAAASHESYLKDYMRKCEGTPKIIKRIKDKFIDK